MSRPRNFSFPQILFVAFSATWGLLCLLGAIAVAYVLVSPSE